MPIRGVVLLIWFVVSLPVCFVRPFYGILMWYIVTIGNPQSQVYYWRVATIVPWGILVAVPTVIGMLAFGRNQFRMYRSPEVLMMFVLWVWFTITSIISTQNPLFVHHAADTWAHWDTVTKMLLMTLMTISMTDSWYRLKLLVRVIAATFAFFILKGIPFLLLTRGQFHLLGPERSMIGDNNDFGLALDMTLPIFFFMAQLMESRRWRFFYYCLFACTIPAIFFTYSRGALVGLVVVGALMLMRVKQRFLIIPVILLGGLVAFTFAPQAWRDRMDPSQKADSSVHSRLNAWAFSENLVFDFPITGGGFATFTRPLYAIYAPDHTLEIVGPHSIYFEVAAEHGFVGLGLYLILMGICFVGGYKLMREARWHGDTETILYLNMFRFSLLAFLVSGSFLQRAYFDYAFCIIACLVILRRIAYERWDEAEAAEAAEIEAVDGVIA